MIVRQLGRVVGSFLSKSLPREQKRRSRARPLGKWLGIEALETRRLLSVSGPVCDASLVACYAEPSYQVLHSEHEVQSLSSSTPVGLTPAKIRHAYGFDQIFFNGTIVGDGTGQTIAIVDAYDNPQIANDLTQFDLAFGLPAPPS